MAFHYSSFDEGAVADFTNLETVVNVSPIPTSRIHSTHPRALILGDPNSAVQTRSKVNTSSGAHAFVSYVQKQIKLTIRTFIILFCMIRSQHEPKKISEALEDESWVDAMQEELLQFEIQKVWVLVDLPYGKKAIGTKWVYQNKKDERGVVVKIKQGKIDEEFYVTSTTQSFLNLNILIKVYKVVNLSNSTSSSKAWRLISWHEEATIIATSTYRGQNICCSKLLRFIRRIEDSLQKGYWKDCSTPATLIGSYSLVDNKVSTASAKPKFSRFSPSTDRPIVSTDGFKVSTDKHIEGTDEQVEGTEEQVEGTEEKNEGIEEQNKGTEETIVSLYQRLIQKTKERRRKKRDDESQSESEDRLLAEKLHITRKEINSTLNDRAKFLHDTNAALKKHVGNYKHAELKIKKFEEVQALYEKIKRSDEDFISIGSAEDESQTKLDVAEKNLLSLLRRQKLQQKKDRVFTSSRNDMSINQRYIEYSFLKTNTPTNQEDTGVSDAALTKDTKEQDQYAELRANTFSRSDHKDANEHIEKVFEIVDLFHIPNITIDQVMLRAFPMSLTGPAIRWLRNKPSGSITTWGDLKTKFLSKYCLPARTAKKMEKINNFQQEPDEKTSIKLGSDLKNS
ncbi:putative ribonuclease H-like domain-containing protein [Tanacetum coccineum]